MLLPAKQPATSASRGVPDTHACGASHLVDGTTPTTVTCTVRCGKASSRGLPAPRMPADEPLAALCHPSLACKTHLRRLLLGDGVLAEPILRPPRHVAKVPARGNDTLDRNKRSAGAGRAGRGSGRARGRSPPQAARPGGPPALGLGRPVELPQPGPRVPAGGAHLLLLVPRALAAATAEAVRLGAAPKTCGRVGGALR